MAVPTIVIVIHTTDPDLVRDVLDLVTGKTAEVFDRLTAQTQADQAQASSGLAQTKPPI